MTLAAECKCGNVGGYCNGGEGCFFKPVSEIGKEIRAFSAERIQKRIADLESKNTALKLEVESCKSHISELEAKNSEWESHLIDQGAKFLVSTDELFNKAADLEAENKYLMEVVRMIVDYFDSDQNFEVSMKVIIEKSKMILKS